MRAVTRSPSPTFCAHGKRPQRSGAQVAALVAQLTEDPGIPGYDERGRDPRRRAAGDGHHPEVPFLEWLEDDLPRPRARAGATA